MPLRKANGKWHWRFQVDGVVYRGGTSLAATPRNRSAALRIEYQAQDKVLAGQGASLKLTVMTFSEGVEQFLRWADGEYREHPATARRHGVTLASCRRFFEKRSVHSITAGDIEDFKSWRRTEHEVREVTLRHDLHTLSKFFGYALLHDWARMNPVRDPRVEIPSDKNALRANVLNPGEEMTYFEAAGRYANLYDLGRIVMRQGMRPGEVMELEQQNIDLDRGTIHIPKGKSSAARRTLHLAPDGEIEAILRRRLNDGQWVFPGKKKGTHISKLNSSHGKVLAATGLRLVLYDLRHTFATRMAERGMDLATLAAILGHSDLRKVQRYVHITERHQRAAMRQYGAEPGLSHGSFVAVTDVN